MFFYGDVISELHDNEDCQFHYLQFGSLLVSPHFCNPDSCWGLATLISSCLPSSSRPKENFKGDG